MSNQIEDIRNQLRELPTRIDTARKELIEKKGKHRQMKAEYEIEMALSFLEHKEGTLKERESKVLVANKDKYMAIAEAKKQEDIAQAALDYAEDLYIAIRKDASLTEEELRNH